MINALARKSANTEVAVPQIRASRRNVQMERNDIEWFADGGVMRLRFRETSNDVLFKRMQRHQISQSEIDRLPEFIKRIAWNRCLLNYDYESLYYLPNRPNCVWKPEDDNFSNDQCSPSQAKEIMREFGIKNLMGLSDDL